MSVFSVCLLVWPGSPFLSFFCVCKYIMCFLSQKASIIDHMNHCQVAWSQGNFWAILYGTNLWESFYCIDRSASYFTTLWNFLFQLGKLLLCLIRKLRCVIALITSALYNMLLFLILWCMYFLLPLPILDQWTLFLSILSAGGFLLLLSLWDTHSKRPALYVCLCVCIGAANNSNFHYQLIC